MNPWRSLLRSLKAELDRASQEVGGRKVLPNAIDVALPSGRYECLTPVLEAVAAEIGEALVGWAQKSRRGWYEEQGPHLTLHLESGARTEIVCEFKRSHQLG